MGVAAGPYNPRDGLIFCFSILNFFKFRDILIYTQAKDLRVFIFL